MLLSRGRVGQARGNEQETGTRPAAAGAGRATSVAGGDILRPHMDRARWPSAGLAASGAAGGDREVPHRAGAAESGPRVLDRRRTHTHTRVVVVVDRVGPDDVSPLVEGQELVPQQLPAALWFVKTSSHPISTAVMSTVSTGGGSSTVSTLGEVVDERRLHARRYRFFRERLLRRPRRRSRRRRRPGARAGTAAAATTASGGTVVSFHDSGRFRLIKSRLAAAQAQSSKKIKQRRRMTSRTGMSPSSAAFFFDGGARVGAAVGGARSTSVGATIVGSVTARAGSRRWRARPDARRAPSMARPRRRGVTLISKTIARGAIRVGEAMHMRAGRTRCSVSAPEARCRRRAHAGGLGVQIGDRAVHQTRASESTSPCTSSSRMPPASRGRRAQRRVRVVRACECMQRPVNAREEQESEERARARARARRARAVVAAARRAPRSLRSSPRSAAALQRELVHQVSAVLGVDDLDKTGGRSALAVAEQHARRPGSGQLPPAVA